MALFQKSVINTYLKLQNTELVLIAYNKHTSYFHDPIRLVFIKGWKEEQYQAKFLDELFVTILGFTMYPKPDYNLTTEFKNEKNNRKADGALLNKGKAIGVIELKGTNTKDLESIRKQAFDYKANQKDCVYVITSNFEKLRFYINDATEFLEFNLFNVSEEEFALLYLCLHKDSIVTNLPLKIKEESITKEEQITKKFYADYSVFKRELYRNLVKQNAKEIKSHFSQSELVEDPNTELKQLEKNVKLSLFKKSQKLIDRFLFIFFAEDRGLLPANSTVQILNKWKADNDFGDERPLYDLFKQYFHFLDSGRKGTTSRAEIYAYNGGLFKPDSILDQLVIDDSLLYKHTLQLANYDFESQVDVNILGHIFENSLTEIESVNAEIEGAAFDKQKSKRKKDGVFYTPKYITKYIVENTIGKLCEEKKQELGFQEEEYFKSRTNRPKKKLQELIDLLNTYRKWLLQLTICDPACGSGAFLNQALDFLIKEHRYIDELKATLLGSGIVFSDIETTVLENNIYGVDLNEESVEIAKLSLWLRTAQPRRKLNDLSSNIKCGNSLIDDKKVAGDKAFNWEREFPQIFKQKEKKAFHITTAIHDSRTSDRMVKYKVREKRAMGTNPYPNVIYFTEEDDLVITQTVAEIVAEDNLKVLAYNICADHLHLLLVCDEADIPKIMQKVKGRSSRVVKGLKSLVALGADDKPLWAQKYYAKPVTTETHLHAAIDYIAHNRTKHELPEHSREIHNLIDAMCCSYQEAFKEDNGGFDVVIGNPPYVRAELLSNYMSFFEKKYRVYHSASDLFAYFYELGSKLINEKGVMGYISNTFDKTTAGKVLREYLTNETRLIKYIDFTEVQVFEGATTYPVIIILDGNEEFKEEFDYVKIPKKSQNRVINVENHPEVMVSQFLLDSNSWSFSSSDKAKILNKISQNKNLREIYGKCYYGIKTALNEAFIVNKDWSDSKHIKPILEGKEIQKWNVPKVEQKLILFKSKWTNAAYPDLETEKEKLEALVKDYPLIMEHLIPFEERAIKRYDKGDYWWELRNCAYYDLFSKPKIIFPNLQNSNKFCLDNQGNYINAPAVFLPTGSKALLCVLNSRIVWEFLKSICVVRSGGYIEVKPQYFEQIPIPEFRNEDKFNEKASFMIEKVDELQKLIGKFHRSIQRKFEGLDKLSKKLENWYELSYAEFIKELAKKKIKLSLAEEAEWEDYFVSEQRKALALKTQIDATDKEIDAMVYELYGLTEEEIKIVERGT